MRNASRIPLVLVAGLSAAVGAAALLLPPRSASADDMKIVPPPALDLPSGNPAAKTDAAVSDAAKPETAVFAGGCFWGVQGVFQHVKGVSSAVSGYSGGSRTSASYPVVSSGMTGHAESVKVTFDPRQVSYGKLLQIYFSVVADPTKLNAQGPDEGTQYRTDLFAMTPEQAKVAKAYIEQLGKAHVFAAPIVTKVSSFQAFYPAEGYHQNYLTQHPDDAYIVENDMPKVKGLKSLFPADFKASPALVAAGH